MNRLAGLMTLALGLASPSMSAAQTPPEQLLPPPPAPPPIATPATPSPQAAPAPIPSPTGATCLVGVHQGIADADAATVAEIVCNELRRQSPNNARTYAVEVNRVGARGTLSLCEIAPTGAVVGRRTREIESIQATYRETPGLVREVLTGGPLHRDAAPPEPVMQSRWYGWQTLVADGAALTLFFAAKDGDDFDPTTLQAAGWVYGIGGPAVHLAHGNWGRAALSLGARGLALGTTYSALESSDDMVEFFAALLYGSAAMSGVVALDAAAFARDKVPRKPQTLQWIVSPTAGRSGAGLQLGGVF